MSPTIAPSRSRLAVMPSMQLTRSVRIARRIQVMDWKIECAMTGSNAFSCSCPPSTAIVTVRSAPATAKATWLTTSGMTGLTFPGMMLDPACCAGRLISPNPACGPDESRRRSLQIFESLMALRLSDAENDMNDPVSLVDSTRSAAVARSRPRDLAKMPDHRGGVVARGS